MKTIVFNKQEDYLYEAVESFKAARAPMALTGAGISVNSGIADFRSPGGVWTIFSPEEYATLDVFLTNPEKAWRLYRELGKTLVGKTPNRGHRALFELEKAGKLNTIVTQNVDNLHQAAGNTKVLEIHGNHLHLQCLQCGNLIEIREEHNLSPQVPKCKLCNYQLKPNVVLFGEEVRSLGQILEAISACDALLVIGTSAQVYPAAGFPAQVRQQGGLIFEFNLESSLNTHSLAAGTSLAHYYFPGDLSHSLPLFKDAVLAR